MNPIVYTYKEDNGSAKKIAHELSCPYHHPGSDYEYTPGDMIINWGNGRPMGAPQEAKILNRYRAVLNSVNKRTSFELFTAGGVSVPPYTKDRGVAMRWATQGGLVFCREELESCNGAGIVLARTAEEVSNYAPLFTQYIKNDREFRVHVFKGRVIFFTEKGLTSESGPNPDHLIKSGDDWSMCWVDDIPQVVKDEAILATDALELDFAAIDIGYRTLDNRAFVFESNTAPGAFGRVTLARYIEAFRSEL